MHDAGLGVKKSKGSEVYEGQDKKFAAVAKFMLNFWKGTSHYLMQKRWGQVFDAPASTSWATV